MSLNDEIRKVLTEFGESLNDDTRKSLRDKLYKRAVDTVAKSKFKDKSVKKLESRLEATAKPLPVTYQNGVLTLKFEMNDYWRFVDEGRKAGSVSEDGQSKIAQWSDTRGLAEKIRISDLANRKQKQSLSKRKGLKTLKKMPFDRAKKAAGYLVARSLKKKSLDPTHFFDEVINDGRIEELKQRLTEVIKKDIQIQISNGING